MSLRILLLNDVVGSLTIDKYDPIDINNVTQLVKRSEEHHGVIYEVVFDFEFIKLGRDFVKRAFEEDQGIDTVVTVIMYERDPNARRWKLYSTGQVNYNKYDLSETTVVVNIEQTGVERRVLNLLETDVDLKTEISENGSALPPQIVWESMFHSKRIPRQFVAQGTTDAFGAEPVTTNFFTKFYVSFPWEPTFDEIQKRFSYPFEFSKLDPTDIDKFDFKIAEAGTYTISIPSMAMQMFTNYRNAVTPKNVYIKIILGVFHEGVLSKIELLDYTSPNIPDDDPDGITFKFGEDLNYEQEFELDVDDQIFLYMEFQFLPISPGSFGEFSLFNFQYPPPPVIKQSINIQSLTEVEPSIVEHVMIYEAVERCVQFYTNQIDCFRSTLLGRVDRGYDVDGEGSMIAWTSGRRLRGFTLQPIFANLQELLNFLNAVYCIGYGFETVDGKQIFVLEKIEYFYDKSAVSLHLGKVYGAKLRVDPKKYFNSIEYGYTTKVDVAKANAIDEFNCLRRSIIPVINTKNKLKIGTSTITSGYIIENQRRLLDSTVDSKYDDLNFAVVMIRDGGGFKTKTIEGYTEIDNIVDIPSVYNLDISPARCLRNWLKIIASSLIRSNDKVVKFSWGERNFILVSQKDTEVELIDEKGNVSVVNVEPIWYNEVYTIPNTKLTRQQVTQYKANPYKVISFEDHTGAILEGFISTEGIEHDSNANKGDLQLLRVYRKII